MRRPGNTITAILPAAFMLMFLPAVFGDDISRLREQITRLSARLEKVETRQSRRAQKEEVAKMMKEILNDARTAPALPAWMKNLKFFGDFRVRFEHQSFQGRRGGGTSPANPAVGEAKDRNRIRLRLRFGFIKTWWDDQMEVGFRLASGETAEPAGMNQTLTGDFSKKNIWIDLMYAKYKPAWAGGLEIAGGKVLNPIKTRTFITWDSSLNPEGIYVDYVAPQFGDFKPYGQLGFWFVNENGARATPAPNNATVRDTVMLHYGLGFEWKIRDSLEWFFGATYYKYYNADASTGGWLGRWGADGQWADNGGGVRPNQGYPSADFSLLELTTRVGWKFAFLPAPLETWSAWMTFVHNFKDDYSVSKNPPNPALGGIGADRHFQDDPNAFGVGVQVGQNKKKNDFSLAYAWYYIEYGSVVPGFGDLTFGGPNHQGHMLQAVYNIDDFLTLSGLMALYQPIHTNDNQANSNNPNDPAGPAVIFPHSQDITATFRLELLWRF
jgi:hypothetical protein